MDSHLVNDQKRIFLATYPEFSVFSSLEKNVISIGVKSKHLFFKHPVNQINIIGQSHSSLNKSNVLILVAQILDQNLNKIGRILILTKQDLKIQVIPQSCYVLIEICALLL